MHEAGGDVVLAGFLRRWAAIFLDQLLLTGVLYLLIFIVAVIAGAAGLFAGVDSDAPPPWMVAGYFAFIFGYYVIAGLYYSLFESSASQATLGKMALGIKVTDEHGGRLTLPHALGRWFAAGLSYLTLYLGFLAAAFTERKQALHDLVAKTLVVDKWAYTEFPERQQRGTSGCVIAFVVLMVLMVGVGGLGILAAIAIPAYQDYVVRARAVGAHTALQPLQAAVEAGGECVATGQPGGLVERIEAETLANGACQFTAWLPAGASGASGDYLAVQRDPDSGRWSCVSNLPDRQLPSACR